MEIFSAVPVKQDMQIKELAVMAKEIWEEHYTPIIGEQQVRYMVDKFQSYPALKHAMDQEGYEYYYLDYLGNKAGYTGIRIDDDGMYLSKFYIKKEFRGKKIARQAMNFLQDLAKQRGCERIWLTCNRNNLHSLKAYDRLGFHRIGEADTDIGNGYLMNDYIMEKYVDEEV